MAQETAIEAGYVLTDEGSILVQLPAQNTWGFELANDDQSWPGGFGVASSWQLLSEDDPRITAEDRDELEWYLDQHTDSQERLRALWNALDTPVVPILDEHGNQPANQQVRATRHPDLVLCVDDVDGFALLARAGYADVLDHDA